MGEAQNIVACAAVWGIRSRPLLVSQRGIFISAIFSSRFLYFVLSPLYIYVIQSLPPFRSTRLPFPNME